MAKPLPKVLILGLLLSGVVWPAFSQEKPQNGLAYVVHFPGAAEGNADLSVIPEEESGTWAVLRSGAVIGHVSVEQEDVLVRPTDGDEVALPIRGGERTIVAVAPVGPALLVSHLHVGVKMWERLTEDAKLWPDLQVETAKCFSRAGVAFAQGMKQRARETRRAFVRDVPVNGEEMSVWDVCVLADRNPLTRAFIISMAKPYVELFTTGEIFRLAEDAVRTPSYMWKAFQSRDPAIQAQTYVKLQIQNLTLYFALAGLQRSLLPVANAVVPRVAPAISKAGAGVAGALESIGNQGSPGPWILQPAGGGGGMSVSVVYAAGSAAEGVGVVSGAAAAEAAGGAVAGLGMMAITGAAGSAVSGFQEGLKGSRWYPNYFDAPGEIELLNTVNGDPAVLHVRIRGMDDRGIHVRHRGGEDELIYWRNIRHWEIRAVPSFVKEGSVIEYTVRDQTRLAVYLGEDSKTVTLRPLEGNPVRGMMVEGNKITLPKISLKLSDTRLISAPLEEGRKMFVLTESGKIAVGKIKSVNTHTITVGDRVVNQLQARQIDVVAGQAAKNHLRYVQEALQRDKPYGGAFESVPELLEWARSNYPTIYYDAVGAAERAVMRLRCVPRYVLDRYNGRVNMGRALEEARRAGKNLADPEVWHEIHHSLDPNYRQIFDRLRDVHVVGGSSFRRWTVDQVIEKAADLAHLTVGEY